mgnify:CR=1 FL=1
MPVYLKDPNKGTIVPYQSTGAVDYKMALKSGYIPITVPMATLINAKGDRVQVRTDVATSQKIHNPAELTNYTENQIIRKPDGTIWLKGTQDYFAEGYKLEKAPGVADTPFTGQDTRTNTSIDQGNAKRATLAFTGTPGTSGATPTPAPVSSGSSAFAVIPPSLPTESKPPTSSSVKLNINDQNQREMGLASKQYDITPVNYDSNGVIKTDYYGTQKPLATLINAKGDRVQVRTDVATSQKIHNPAELTNYTENQIIRKPDGTIWLKGTQDYFAEGYKLEKAPGVADTPFTGQNTRTNTSIDQKNAKRATLVNANGNRVVVEVGSPEAQRYFGMGYHLEESKDAPDVAVTMVGPNGQRVAASNKEQAMDYMKSGFIPETQLSNPDTATRSDNRMNKLNNTNDANALLNEGQNYDFNIMDSVTGPATKSPTIDWNALITQVMQTKSPVQAPDYMAQYKQMRTEYGLDSLQQQAADLQKEIDDLTAQKRQRIQAEEGKTVSTGVISGRVSEIERQENERIDAAQRQLSYVSQQMKNGNDTISMLMGFSKDTYDAAYKQYNDQYSRSIDVINLLRDLSKDERDIETQKKDDARANLQTIYNNMTAGGVDPESITDEQRMMIQRMEMQAGLPVGFFDSLKAKNPKQSIIATKESTEGGRTYENVIMMDENGNITSKRIDVGEAKAGSGETLTPAQIIDVFKNFENPEETIAYLTGKSVTGKTGIEQGKSYVDSYLSKLGTITQEPYGKYSHANTIAWDVATEVGTPIAAPPMQGTVIAQGTYNQNSKTNPGGMKAYGNYVDIQDDVTGAVYRIGHMSEMSVKKGDKITGGQQIGLSGNTGWSTGPHIHFEVVKAGNGAGTPVPIPKTTSTKTDSERKAEEAKVREQELATARTNIAKDIQVSTGSDGYIDSSKYPQIRQNIAVNEPDLLKWFDETYPPKQYLNPNDPQAQSYFY